MHNNPEQPVTTEQKSLSFPPVYSCLLLAFTCLVGSVYLFRPLYDPDFYWHLKTGEWIWQNLSLPQSDPFGVPPLASPSPRNDFILTSYWLIQLILYAFYSLFGMPGIILFRWIAAGLSLALLSRWTNLRNGLAVAVLAIATILILEYYFIERPQFVSFICFGALLILLFRITDRAAERSLWSSLIPLSLLMTLWANMHGGYLIGLSILIFFAGAEGLKFSSRSLQPLPVQEYKYLLIAVSGALIASFLNPNGINLFKYLPTIFDSGNYANLNNLEELSLLHYYNETRDNTIFLYLTTLCVTFAALVTSRQRTNITWIGLLAGTAYMGSQHMRLMPFFLVTALLFLTEYFAAEESGRIKRGILVSLLTLTTLVCFRDEFPRMLQATTSGVVPTDHYPVAAADFMSKMNSSSHVFTTMHWGGYLLWRIGPQNKIFHDSRYLNLQRAWEYDNSNRIALNQRSYWQGMFNAYNIGVAILPVYENDGSPYLLTQSIAADKDWTVAFATETEVVFVRSGLPRKD